MGQFAARRQPVCSKNYIRVSSNPPFSLRDKNDEQSDTSSHRKPTRGRPSPANGCSANGPGETRGGRNQSVWQRFIERVIERPTHAFVGTVLRGNPDRELRIGSDKTCKCRSSRAVQLAVKAR